MSISKRDKEFRTPKTTYVDFKHIEMDRALTMLFPRLKYDGYSSRFMRGKTLNISDFMNEFVEHEEWFKYFSENKDIVYKWIETDLLDLVNRGKPNQAVAAPRPLHGNTYKFRNNKYSRDYGTAEQIYWMLYYARKGKGQDARDALKRYFFAGYDLITNKYDQDFQVDVETQAILRLDSQVTQDTKDSNEPDRFVPLCIGQADILADDILRLLAYESYIPRSVLVDYLKTLMSFHMALYHLRLLYTLPKYVKQKYVTTVCSLKECPINSNQENALDGCPHKIAMIIDMGNTNNIHMSELAKKSAEKFYRQIPEFAHANFTIKKLDEMADYLCNRTGRLSVPPSGYFAVSDLITLLKPEFDSERQAYFKFRLASLLEDSSGENNDIDPEIAKILDLNLSEFDTFIEILVCYFGKSRQEMIIKCLDSFMNKNKDNGLMIQSRAKGSPRKFVLGSRLLEVLLQIAVITSESGSFITREMRIEELLSFLRNRYGIYIDRLPNDNKTSILDRKALRHNVEAFKLRLREIGFYEDLSDAYVTQRISPRYTIQRNNLK